MPDLVDVDPRAVIEEINVVRVANGSNIELFQYSAPDQDTRFAVNSSYSGHHIAIYVDCIGPVGRQPRQAPRRAPAARPAAGDGRTRRRPVDQLLRNAVRDVRRADLLSHGMAYEATADVKLWSPKDVPLKRRHRS